MEHMYWMWPKRKFGGGAGSHDAALTISSSSSSYNDSWEEQAFAEDSSGGALGGCIWPPRSYTCSFCRREFRSAQALGGHMNVHRRDRARLKQSPNAHQFPCSMAYSPNPNPNGDVVPLSPCRVSVVPTATTQDHDYSEQAFFSPLPTLLDRGLLGLKRGRENSRIEEKGCRADKTGYDSTVKTCDLIVRRSSQIDDEKEEERIEFKRAKRDDGTYLFLKSDISEKRRSDVLLPFFIKTNLGERQHHHHHQSEVTGIRAATMDDLDLELRLGDPPKVK
ncbi:hypothetical protein ACLOJK_012679 [Asimina triloba]